jgi:hypothetical protein
MTAPTSELGYAVPTVAGGVGWWPTVDDEPTPELRWPLSISVFDRMRRQDAQVSSVLRAVTLPIRRTAARLDPANAAPNVVSHVSEDLGLPVIGAQPAPRLRTRDRFSWVEHLRMALLMLVFGHMFFEPVYRIDGDGFARLRKLGPRMPSSIASFDIAADGGLNAITQYAYTTADAPTIPINRLVVYTNDRESGNWLGVSLLRTCYKNWLIKDRLLRVQAQSIERNGMGVPMYYGAEGESDLAKGLSLATSIRAGDSAGGAIPHGATLRLQGVEGALPNADPAIRYHDEQIARAVLAHFLNLGTQTGSWALGNTFADFFTLSLTAVAEQIADVVNQHVIEDMVDLNFGEGEPAPRLVFDEIGSSHTATAEAIKALVDAGVVFPDRQLEEFVRRIYQLPASPFPMPTPLPGEPVLGG